MNNERESKILERIKMTIELFFENDGKISDTDLARLVFLNGYETSSSTVGRDLTSLKALSLVGEKKMSLIKELRTLNKHEGTRKGGIMSISNNDILRDSNGKFQGSSKRPR